MKIKYHYIVDVYIFYLKKRKHLRSQKQIYSTRFSSKSLQHKVNNKFVNNSISFNY